MAFAIARYTLSPDIHFALGQLHPWTKRSKYPPVRRRPEAAIFVYRIMSSDAGRLYQAIPRPFCKPIACQGHLQFRQNVFVVDFMGLRLILLSSFLFAAPYRQPVS